MANSAVQNAEIQPKQQDLDRVARNDRARETMPTNGISKADDQSLPLAVSLSFFPKPKVRTIANAQVTEGKNKNIFE